MIYPSIDRLITRGDSKYTLVITAAKRARQLNEGSSSLIEAASAKDVSVALEELAQGKISYERIKTGVK
ncbi:MAG: DNA-directed RNA polymerase subunit omega [Dethiobacter sp.]|nr:DNA-directed RNA polymerase subunit omega [Dethiobacter sp.]MCL5981348.1 DNA-directed RNA polymerase subunit omega [Bacillota bacterium]